MVIYCKNDQECRIVYNLKFDGEHRDKYDGVGYITQLILKIYCINNQQTTIGLLLRLRNRLILTLFKR